MTTVRSVIILFALLLSTVAALVGEAVQPGVLWSDKPVVIPESYGKLLKYAAAYWSQHVFPMGNGRLGFTVFGDPDRERIHFNEDSLWVGNEDHTGGYQPFGDIYVELGHKPHTNYHRRLDITRAVQTVSYQSGGVTYKREYFASYPAQVMAFRFTANRPGALSGAVWLDSMHRSRFAESQGHDPKSMAAIATTAEGRTLLSAEIRNVSSEDGKCVVRYGATTLTVQIPRGTPALVEDL